MNFSHVFTWFFAQLTRSNIFSKNYCEMNSREYYPVKTIRLQARVAADLQHAALMLSQGKIVALATETVYGLAANGLSETAIKKVFAAKNRPFNNPLILHVHDQPEASSLLDLSGSHLVQQRFSLLAKTFWPGPLTIIAKKSSHIPLVATADQKTAAVRVPHNGKTRAIMQMCNFPLVMPSANLSTRPSPTCADHVLKTLNGRIDAVVDDGPCNVGIESTVVKIDEDCVKILRPGIIHQHALSACLGEPVAFAHENHIKACSPGQSLLHYSPQINSVSVCTRENAEELWDSLDSFFLRRSDFDSLTNKLGQRPKEAANFLLSDNANDYARELYAALYQTEQNQSSSLIIVLPNSDDEWSAIIDRLKRTVRKPL